MILQGCIIRGREEGPAKCELGVRTLLRTVFADHSSLIPKVACAWSAFQTNVLPEKPLLAQHLPNFCLGKERQQEERS